MEDYYAMLERHEQTIKILERDITSIHEIQKEIRSMNETLVTFAAELKHTNKHLASHEIKIQEFDKQPHLRMQQLFTALTSAVAGGVVTMFISLIV